MITSKWSERSCLLFFKAFERSFLGNLNPNITHHVERILKDVYLILAISFFIFYFILGWGRWAGGWKFCISLIWNLTRVLCIIISYSSLFHQVLVNHVGNGFHHSLPQSETSFLSGIKQRLLSYIFRGIWNEADQTMVSKRILISVCAKSVSMLIAWLLCNLLCHQSCKSLDYSDLSLMLFYLSIFYWFWPHTNGGSLLLVLYFLFGDVSLLWMKFIW